MASRPITPSPTPIHNPPPIAGIAIGLVLSLLLWAGVALAFFLLR